MGLDAEALAEVRRIVREETGAGGVPVVLVERLVDRLIVSDERHQELLRELLERASNAKNLGSHALSSYPLVRGSDTPERKDPPDAPAPVPAPAPKGPASPSGAAATPPGHAGRGRQLDHVVPIVNADTSGTVPSDKVQGLSRLAYPKLNALVVGEGIRDTTPREDPLPSDAGAAAP